MYKVKLKDNIQSSKVEQIVHAMAKDIDNNVLKQGQQLPTINDFSEQNKVARDTIEKAYKRLRTKGYIASYPGRGYFVLDKKRKKLRVLLIFNKISSFKKIIYDSILEGLFKKAKVDLRIHHYDPNLLREILDDTIGRYDYYVIMPHFLSYAKEKQYIDIIKMIPRHELILLDKNLPQLKFPYKAVYQDFKMDIYEALNSSVGVIRKYKNITLVLPKEIHHPKELAKGISDFCDEQSLVFRVIEYINYESIIKHTLFIVTDEENLAQLLKKIGELNLVLQRDIGIVSFNETVFKELLNITVVSTDFAKMGRTVAKLILGKEIGQHKNPFYLIKRKSL